MKRTILMFGAVLLLFGQPVCAQEPMVGEIRMFAGTFAPRGWALCNGQTLSISENQTLYSILLTTYGGNGVTTFALPDLRGRTPIHAGTGPGLSDRRLGARGGSETVTLSLNELPSHNHSFPFGVSKPEEPGFSIVQGGSTSSGYGHTNEAGNGGGHENLPPFCTVNYIIATVGIYPSRP